MKFYKTIAFTLVLALMFSAMPVFGQKYSDKLEELQKQLEENNKKMELTKNNKLQSRRKAKMYQNR